MLARLAELPLLVVLLGLSGAISLVPALYAFGANDHEHARDFLYSALILLVITVINLVGVKQASWAVDVFTIAKLLPLALLNIFITSACVVALS